MSTLVQWKGGSQQWKFILQNRDCIEKYLWWEPKRGSSTVWYDNWTSLGPLHTLQLDISSCHPLIDIEVFLKDTGWDYIEMENHVPVHLVDFIKQHMDCVRQSDGSDKPWWLKTSSGIFSVRAAWELLIKESGGF